MELVDTLKATTKTRYFHGGFFYFSGVKITWIFKDFSQLSIKEMYEVMQLRQEVFIVEQDCPYLDADGKDKQSHHLLGYDIEGVLVAYLRLLAPGVSYSEISLGRIVTSTKCRGKGIGKMLMKQGINESELLYGKVSIRISAQSYLISLLPCFWF